MKKLLLICLLFSFSTRAQTLTIDSVKPDTVHRYSGQLLTIYTTASGFSSGFILHTRIAGQDVDTFTYQQLVDSNFIWKTYTPYLGSWIGSYVDVRMYGGLYLIYVTAAIPVGIIEPNNKREAKQTLYYNLSGQQTTSPKGAVIESVLFTDGSIRRRIIFIQ